MTTDVTTEEAAVETSWQNDLLDTLKKVNSLIELSNHVSHQYTSKTFVQSFTAHPGFNLKQLIKLRGNRDACKETINGCANLSRLKEAMLRQGMLMCQKVVFIPTEMPLEELVDEDFMVDGAQLDAPSLACNRIAIGHVLHKAYGKVQDGQMTDAEYIAFASRLKMFAEPPPTTVGEVNACPKIRIAMGLFTVAELLPILCLNPRS
jgi:hypothetical protein